MLVAAIALSTIPGGPAGDAGAAVSPPTFRTYAAPSNLFDVSNAGEPSVGVNWNTGAVFFQAYASTYKVTFDASDNAAWSDVTSPSSIINIDPILFTDSPTGRTYAGGLNGPCSVLSYTTTDGASWQQMGNACAGAAADHETIGAGAWHQPKPLNAIHDRATYYCAQTSAVQCSVSYDGGLTFQPGTAVTCGYVNPGLHGSVHVAANGVAYLPFETCGDVNGVAVTSDNGLTWVSRPIPGASSPSIGFDPDVGSTASSWAYVAYPTSGWGVGAALTKDAGATWTNFGDVAAAAGIRSSAFHEMVAGDDQRAFAVYIGSTTDGDPHSEGFAGVWHVYVTYTTNGGSSWSTVRASDNVIQRGWICAGGLGCGSGRNLLDFFDAQVEKDGSLVIALADGCTGACETGGNNNDDAYATIVRQVGGSGVFAAYDPSGPSAPGAPALSGTAGDARNTLSWTTPADGGSAITGYKLYRNGGLYQSLGVQNSYVDTGVTNGQTYTYQVSAVNAVGEGAKSNSVSLTPIHVNPPSAPQSLTAKHANGPNSGKIKLDWTAPASNGGAAVTNYKIYRGTSSGGESYLTTVGNVLTYTDSGLTTGATYYYKVSAVNSAGEGALSNEASAVG